MRVWENGGLHVTFSGVSGPVIVFCVMVYLMTSLKPGLLLAPAGSRVPVKKPGVANIYVLCHRSVLVVLDSIFDSGY